MRVVTMVNDRVLVEDVEEIDCDMVTDYNVLLEFDVERTPLGFDDRGEDLEANSVYDDHCSFESSHISGCVVDMIARTVEGIREKRVRHSNVWLPDECFYKHSIHAQFGVDSAS